MTDWVAATSALLAAIGLIFAGYQTRRLHRDGVREQKLERDGVVVSWTPVITPNRAEPNGLATWVYEFEAHNPGRFTVDDVVIAVQFPRDFERLRHDCSREPRTRVMTLRTPVLRGGGSRKWTRHISMEITGPDLSLTFADISFFDADQRSRTNRWPRSARSKADLG